MHDELLSLLGERPLFYLQKDFKLLLGKALKSFARQADQEMRQLKALLEEDGEAATPVILTGAEIRHLA